MERGADAEQTDRRAAIAEAVGAAFEAETVPLLASLVEQPSFTADVADVEACFDLLDEAAGRAGLGVERHPDPDGRFAAHRLYLGPALAADPEAVAIALVGHLDTVHPRSLGFRGFSREGDVARGPGVLDMKSGLVSVLAAISALRAVDAARAQRLGARFLVVSDEEVGSPSSKPLIGAVASRTSAALVFEAGRAGDRVITRRKGSGVWTLTAHGTAAHAGAAHTDGVSAIHLLALAIPAVEALTDYARGVTASVGLVEGGTAKNTVPARAVAHVDGRFERAEDAVAFEAALAAIARDPLRGAPPAWAPARLRGARLELSGGVSRPPMEATTASRSLRLRYEAHAEAAGLEIGEAPLIGGGSDANLFSAAGVPAIDGLGPFGRHFHEVREWCSLESLRRRTIALASFLDEEIGS